ncbi:hypothetical protein T265_10788 [Opisthorchis viverrini]|uniref:C2 domain-containing protein n=1 Tax=Opisthorchis viverrini TaxID=6198 RepID=A0A074ZC09_OPIVI|nr:hypothetical protein T265_10788 [Opisthorchis viverrini]KER20735.1 hypothetical protein T265_10788 [Opisthorchis viverrini]
MVGRFSHSERTLLSDNLFSHFGNGEPTNDPTVVSEAYREHYACLYSAPASSSHPLLSRRNYEQPLTDLVFTVEDIRQLLDKINPFCALGPDEVHPRILKEPSSTLANHLHLVFRQSLDEGRILPAWKEAIVTPIYKTATDRQEQNRPGKLGQKPRSCVSIRESVNDLENLRRCIQGILIAGRDPIAMSPSQETNAFHRVTHTKTNPKLLKAVLGTMEGVPAVFTLLPQPQSQSVVSFWDHVGRDGYSQICDYSAKTRRWHVVVAGGKKKMVTDVVDAQDGCPTWDTEFNIDLVSPTDPIVMLILDGERRHIGQVVIPLAQVPRTGPPNFDPSRLRYSELEPTKKNSCPRGRLVYWIWATSYWPPGTKLDSKSKSHKGSISHLGRPKSRSSKAASMVSGAYSESNLSAQTSYMGGYPMTGGGAPSSVAWTNRPGATLGMGGTASYNPLASYDEEGSTRGSQQYGSDMDDPGRPPLYRSALQLKNNQAGYAESTVSGYSGKRGLMRKVKSKLSKSTLSITQAVAKKAGGDKLYPDPHGSVLSVASSREHIQFPDSTSGQNQRPPSGSMTSLPRENYAPDGAVRSGPTEHIQFPDSTSGQNQRPPSGSMTSLPRENYAPDGAVRSGPTDMNETEEGETLRTQRIS